MPVVAPPGWRSFITFPTSNEPSSSGTRALDVKLKDCDSVYVKIILTRRPNKTGKFLGECCKKKFFFVLPPGAHVCLINREKKDSKKARIKNGSLFKVIKSRYFLIQTVSTEGS